MLNDKLDNFTNYQLLSNNQQLKILHTKIEHKGSYACLATNKVASTGISFDVDVLLKPIISEDISSNRTIEILENDGFFFFF